MNELLFHDTSFNIRWSVSAIVPRGTGPNLLRDFTQRRLIFIGSGIPGVRTNWLAPLLRAARAAQACDHLNEFCFSLKPCSISCFSGSFQPHIFASWDIAPSFEGNAAVRPALVSALSQSGFP